MSEDKDSYNIMLSGVGGQGLMLLSQTIGRACGKTDKKVITGEQHGLSQRSGSIYVHLRLGEDAHSPLIPYGEADLMVSLEGIEALRNIEYLKDDGRIITSRRLMHHPLEISRLEQEEEESYVTLEEIEERLEKVTSNIHMIDSLGLAEEAGNARTENVVLLGAICNLPDFPIDGEVLKEVVKETVPEKTIETNLKAFELGEKEASKGL
ncbi:MAG: indolepyruvate oxidoreductase subunit beta [Candidatus Thermoplasmatota archaeon]|nr:indolepyruvate oxidoreductase subunit beta [Candidatus Thermoplasmatota archaeon]MBS3790626.1 indolepyruvate oxidoreductase subunit beta [Candidatus Thermoplasmatota archaeon]